MSSSDQSAFVARVSRYDPDVRNGRQTIFYAVIASSKEAARTAVCGAVGPNDYVEMTDDKLSPSTTLALGLVPGVVKAM